jgi:hypothetical protein
MQKEINTHFSLLTKQEQEFLLNRAKFLLNIDSSSQRIAIKQYNIEIAKSEKEIADGNYITQEALEKELKIKPIK